MNASSEIAMPINATAECAKPPARVKHSLETLVSSAVMNHLRFRPRAGKFKIERRPLVT